MQISIKSIVSLRQTLDLPRWVCPCHWASREGVDLQSPPLFDSNDPEVLTSGIIPPINRTWSLKNSLARPNLKYKVIFASWRGAFGV